MTSIENKQGWFEYDCEDQLAASDAADAWLEGDTMIPSFVLPGSGRYISMRMHGTSAKVQYDPPDRPPKVLNIVRSSSGTIIRANYDTTVGVYFAVPTPAIIEQHNSILTFVSRLFRPTYMEKVFDGAQLRVVRIELYLRRSSRAQLGQLEIMDGEKTLMTNISAEPTLVDPNKDPYREKSTGTHVYDINHEVTTALGIGFTCRFVAGESVDSYLHLIAAKAVFVGST